MNEPAAIRPRISAKALAELNMPEVCERCFGMKWLLNQQPRVGGRQFPFQMGLPGVFSSIDSIPKNAVRLCLDRVGAPPPWFPSTGYPVVGYLDSKLLHWSRFQLLDEATGILLTASPDDILTVEPSLSERRHLIVDYKCARITGTQDFLLPIYAGQLNAEVYIAQNTGLLPIATGLLYLEPVTAVAESDEELAMPFNPVWRPVPLDPDLPLRLLRRARGILDAVNSGVPPPGRPGCPDCALLARLLGVVGGLGPNGGV